jgi:hypothetical protein
MKPRNKHITARTDEETLEWFRKIADNENRSFSSVIHLALKKLKSTFKPEEITREVA